MRFVTRVLASVGTTVLLGGLLVGATPATISAQGQVFRSDTVRYTGRIRLMPNEANATRYAVYFDTCKIFSDSDSQAEGGSTCSLYDNGTLQKTPSGVSRKGGEVTVNSADDGQLRYSFTASGGKIGEGQSSTENGTGTGTEIDGQTGSRNPMTVTETASFTATPNPDFYTMTGTITVSEESTPGDTDNDTLPK